MLQGGMAMGLRSRPSRAADADMDKAACGGTTSRASCSSNGETGPRGRRPPPAAALYGAALLAFVASFAASLAGGRHPEDTAFVHSRSYTAASVSVLVAVTALTAAGWAAAALPRRAQRAAALAALLGVDLLFLWHDHGSDLQHHGLYNQIALWLMTAPLNLVLLGVVGLHRAVGRRRFPAALAGLTLATALAAVLTLRYQQRQFVRGFFGRQLEVGCSGLHCPAGSQPLCNFPHHTPWFDLLPARALNFYTGPQACKAVQGFEATLSQVEGLLTISGCKQEPVEYTVVPRTNEWDLKTRQRDGPLASAVLGAMQAHPYTGPVRLEGEEVVLARCGSRERLLVRVARKEEAVARALLAGAGGAADDSGGSNSSSSHSSNNTRGSGDVPSTAGGPPGEQQRERLNVVVLFLDSVSRRHFFRRLPNTVAALEALHAGRLARLYQFFRHVIVGPNTTKNSHALFTGVPWEHAFGGNITRRSRTMRGKKEACPAFWDAYRAGGYVVGSASNWCGGWDAQFNPLPMRHDHELMAPFCLPEYKPTEGTDPYYVFKGPYSILRRCLNGRLVHEYSMDYMRSFMDAYGGAAPFLFLNTFLEAHEASGEVLATMDASLAGFFGSLSPAELNHTAFVVLGDHGLHMGLSFLYTRSGKVEHANPFLTMLLPAWLEQRHPAAAAALRGNEQKLLSAHDIHATLHHLLHLHQQPPGAPAPGREQLAAWAGTTGGVHRHVFWGSSLLAPLPANRTCEEAGVPPERCWCAFDRDFSRPT